MYAGYRIQRNAVTQHHRLLHPIADARLAWGTFEDCLAAFHAIQARDQIRTNSDHLVLLLHGFLRSKESFTPMQRALIREGYDAVAVNYPSSHRSIAGHAEQVSQILDHAEDVRTVSFVCHSMGGLIARKVLATYADWQSRIQFNRLVMIATPNYGSVAAELLLELPGGVFRALGGPSTEDLAPEGVAKIPIPNQKFGVIAGVKGDGRGFNPLLPGDDDMTVSAESVLLAGAEDSMTINAIHTFIMAKKAVIEATIHYLETGRFQPEREP